jgi:hypothetical protein
LEDGGMQMFKKISKVLVTTAMCTLLMASSVFAGKAYYSFSLGNTGTAIENFSISKNDKTILANPWTLKVTSITCSGQYGVRFAPAMVNSSGNVTRVCTQSAVWRSGTGYGTTAYASGDAALTTYKLGARQDDSYYSTFKSAGWWNADKLSDQ